MDAIRCAWCERIAILRCAACKRYCCSIHCQVIRVPGEGRPRGKVRVYCATCKPKACRDR